MNSTHHSAVAGRSAIWSRQRVTLLNKCAKAYQFRYLNPGGWRQDASPEVRKIYRLAQLQSESSVAGVLIHKHIRRQLAAAINGFPLRMDDAVATAMREFELIVQRGYATRLEDASKDRIRLIRQERGEKLTPAEIRKHQAVISTCLQTWAEMPEICTLIKDAESLIPQYLDPVKPSVFEVGDTKIFVKLDAVSHQGDLVEIWDWKSSRPHRDDQHAAAIFDLFIREALNLNNGQRVKVHFAHLREGSIQTYSFTDDDRESLRYRIADEVTELQLVDAQTEPEDFPPQAGRQCLHCPFQFTCREGFAAACTEAERRLA